MNVPGEPHGRRSVSVAGVFAGVFGAFFGLALLKFHSPPIMQKFEVAPTDFWSFLLNTPWPTGWAYLLFGAVALLGLAAAVWPQMAGGAQIANPDSPGSSLRGMEQGRRLMVWLKRLAAAPLLWLAWEWLAGKRTLDPQLTRPTVLHFAICVACFYLGFFSLSRARNLRPFWTGLFFAFLLVLASGWQQHFGGLAETRRYFLLYIYPQDKNIPLEYWRKMASDRIFATLFYPNTLAGALLLLLPPLLGFIGRARGVLAADARWFVASVVGLASLGCLYWSRSKGGWLLMLALGIMALLRLPFNKRYKVVLITLVLLAGLGGFFCRYMGFFQQGATSVSARFDYWRAAAQITRDHPVFGTGPGTFYIPYQRIKRPESESTRLVHNDYLEQASDSGLPGFVLYAAMIAGGLSCGLRRHEPALGEAFLVWLGVLGWGLQGFMEFSLYIPALAWPSFALIGWLLGRQILSTNPSGSISLGLRHENPLPQRP
jgi:O-antigen ligase